MAKCKQDKEVDYNAVDEFQRYPLIYKKSRTNSNTGGKVTPVNSIFVCLLTLDNSYYQNMTTSNKYSAGVKQRNESLDNIDVMPFDQYVLFSPTETPDKSSYSTKSK
jgi:hypothetical protein